MSAQPSGKALQRETLITMLHAALESGENRFARQAALAWLAAFPGDLEVTLLQAQAMAAEGKPADGTYGRVIPALESLIRKDPFAIDAYRLLARVTFNADAARNALAFSSLYALGGLGPVVPDPARLTAWGEPLRQALAAYASQDYTLAGAHVQEVLRAAPDLVLAAALDLLVNRSLHEPAVVLAQAQAYHERWPDCLPISLVLAELHLQLGDEPEAVKLLHLCAASDTTGQTPTRLWGANHPYQSLWPDDLVIYFDQPIPAGVAGRLGWNRLAPGEIRQSKQANPAAAQPANPTQPGEQTTPAALASEQPVVVLWDEAEMSTAADPLQGDPITGSADHENGLTEAEVASADAEAAAAEAEAAASQAEATSTEAEAAAAEADAVNAEAEDAAATAGAAASEANAVDAAAAEDAATAEALANSAAYAADQADAAAQEDDAKGLPPKYYRRGAPKVDRDGTAHTVENELNRLAKLIKQPALNRADGRFPVYVIFSSLEGLTAQYGPQTTTVLQNEMRKLAAAVRQRPGWGAMVYYPDDAACTAHYGLTPVNPRDPWKLKNALCDLDVALRNRGEMIGALLIVGGDDIIPFHRLPNPTDDQDGEILSDSPYAAIDANYFVPEWPTGRLPGECGPDAALLLDQLHAMQRHHARHKKLHPLLSVDWLSWLNALVERFLPARSVPSFGYTAAVWRRSSLAVFRPIGAPHTVKSSPPEESASIDAEKITLSSLGYYNLHGLEDSPSWYGQRDPLETPDGPDYPVALAPDNLHRNGHSPRVIFSAACYGGYVLGKCENDSLALKFLSMGTLAVIGSTCTAYGSLATPLIAADLLGNLFWQHLKSGRPAGEALMRAKVDLVREMNRRQGFLDGEDQKTLISFVLYGDPLAGYDGFRVQGKAPARMKTHLLVKTIPDHPEATIPTNKVSGEVLKHVKEIVAEYLPGAEIAEMHFTRQSVPGSRKNGSQPGKNGASAQSKQGPAAGRMVVTVSKSVQVAEHIHHHIMRVTLDETGKAVKMSISR